MTVSKKTLAAVLTVVLAAGVAAYVVFVSPRSTAVKVSLTRTTMASTDQEAVSGSVSPAQAGRLVVIEMRTGGGWAEVARTSTDSTGMYKASFGMTDLGRHQLRVRVEKAGRHKSVASAPRQVMILKPTQADVQVPQFARTDRDMRVTGRVNPAAVRTITVQTSTDGQTWTTAGEATSTASGEFNVPAKRFTPGQAQVRVVITASTDSAEFTSATKTVNVEDYKAAGARYLQIVAVANKLGTQLNDMPSSASLASLKDIAKKLSAAYTVESRQFRQYPYWPQEVKAQIELLAKTDVLRADYYNMVANAKNYSDVSGLNYQDPKGADNAPAYIRAALGLPKRE